ncbi:MAG TPA: CPBP family intramembrane glutamic endopeptidase [Acidobacteriaceae bacterium]
MAGLVARIPRSAWPEGAEDGSLHSGFRQRWNAGPTAGLLHRAALANRQLAGRSPDSVQSFPVDLAVLGPLLIVLSRIFVFSALSTEGGPAAWRWHIGALAGIWAPMLNYNLFGGPLFEEFGWRGFLQSRLQRTLPPWIAAVLTGMLWATWHLPLFLVGWGGVSFPLFLLITVSISLIMALAFNASGQVILVAILMHSALNAANRFLPSFLGNVPTRQYPSEALLIAPSFLLVAIVLVTTTRGRFLYRQTR